jgi:hypothetical protein
LIGFLCEFSALLFSLSGEFLSFALSLVEFAGWGGGGAFPPLLSEGPESILIRFFSCSLRYFPPIGSRRSVLAAGTLAGSSTPVL